MTGIYIHVPFCKRKCPYCDFYSVCRPDLYEDYTQAVCRNIEAYKHRKKHEICLLFQTELKIE